MHSEIEIQENVLLGPLTTLGVGGRARLFARAKTEEHVLQVVDFARTKGLGLFILGGGSNVVVADNGFDGLVLQIDLRGVDETTASTVRVGAGEDWDKFVARCVEADQAGVECLSGIPGRVGGTPIQNVGAYGQEVSSTIVDVRCFDRHAGAIVTMSNAQCGFQYRRSVFNSTHRERYIVLSVTFELRHRGDPLIAYKDLADHFAGRSPTLSEVREAVLAIRRAKSMVIDEADPNSRSAGSFFKNPVISSEHLDRLRNSFPQMPYFDAENGAKVPAAWLIEQAGFAKGFALGNAGISLKHTLAVINRGGASAAEILVLRDMIRSGVARTFDIELETEPVFVGF